MGNFPINRAGEQIRPAHLTGFKLLKLLEERASFILQLVNQEYFLRDPLLSNVHCVGVQGIPAAGGAPRSPMEAATILRQTLAQNEVLVVDLLMNKFGPQYQEFVLEQQAAQALKDAEAAKQKAQEPVVDVPSGEAPQEVSES